MVAALAATLTACSQSAPAPTGAAPLTPAQICVAPETLAQVRSLVFEEVAKQAPGADPAGLKRLVDRATVRIDMAVLDQHQADTQKTVCGGRLHVLLPPGLASPDETSDLMADITYTAQPSADGRGVVYSLIGANPLIARLSGLDLVGWSDREALAAVEAHPAQVMEAMPAPAGPAADEAAASPFYPTSFDCAAAQSYAELTICSTPALAEADRRMAATYAAAVARDLTGDVRRAGRIALRERERCQTRTCLSDWFVRREQDLADTP